MKYTRRDFLAKSSLALGAFPILGQAKDLAVSTDTRQRKPNIVIITSHDTGTHLGCYGVPSVHTPNIDALAEDGVLFNNMFSASPMCSPSRGSLLTGRYPENNGLLGLAGNGWEYELGDITEHLSHVLKGNGYYTALFGHNHETRFNDKLGFDEMHPMHKPLPKPIPDDWTRKMMTSKKAWEVAQDAAAFLKTEKAKQQPFYVQIGFHETHTPFLWQDKKPDFSKGTWVPPYTLYPNDDAEFNEHLAGFQASARDLDKCIKVVREALVQSGHEENTILLYNTEHGPEFPRAKWTLLDAGTHVAFIMRWPGGGLTGGIKVDQMLSNIDFLPTITEMTGIRVPHKMDGVSFARLLREPEKKHKPTRDHLFTSYVYGWNFGIRTQKYKYIRNFMANSFNFVRLREGCARPLVELYDLENDPYEQHDLAGNPEYVKVQKELDDRLWRHLEQSEVPVLRGDIDHPFHKVFREEYRANQGNWNADLTDVVAKTKEPSYKYTIETETHRFSFHFRDIFRPNVIQLYDLKADPDCKKSLAMDKKHAEALENMKAKMFTWLEKEGDPILEGPIVDQQPLIDSIAEYKKWKKG